MLFCVIVFWLCLILLIRCCKVHCATMYCVLMDRCSLVPCFSFCFVLCCGFVVPYRVMWQYILQRWALLYNTGLYCTAVMPCFIIYFAVLWQRCTMLCYCTTVRILLYTLLCCTVVCCDVLFELYSVVLKYLVLYCLALDCFVLCCVLQCCTVR